MVNASPGQPEYQFDWQNPEFQGKPQYQVGRVIGRTYQGVLRQWKPIGLTLLAMLVFNFLLTYLSYAITGQTGLESEELLYDSVTDWVTVIGTSVVSIISYMFIMIVTDAAMFGEYTNRPKRFGELAKIGLRKMIPLTFSVFLWTVAYYIGFLFFIIPGLFLYLGWSIIGPVYVNENTGLFASFGRFWELMKGYKRWFFLSSFVIGTINSLIFMVIFFIMILPIVPAVIDNPEIFEGAGIGLALLLGTGMTFAFLLYAVFNASMTTANFLEVRQLKEGAGHDDLADVFT